MSGIALSTEVAWVSAVPINARLEEGIQVPCDRLPPLRVSFEWDGRREVEDYYDEPCDLSYATGQVVPIFVASNDPSNVAPTARWIMHPDGHDPLTPFGPNAVEPMIIVLGTATMAAGAGLVVIALRRRRIT